MNPTRSSPFAALRRFARPEPAIERCELCGAAIAIAHEHLCEPAARRIICACPACALLLGEHQSGRYRRITTRSEALPDLRITDVQLAALGIPVGLAFFYPSRAASGVIAVYPSPAGPLESPVEPDAWASIVANNRAIESLEPDVEAILINRIRGSRQQYRCSIDHCYHLIGLVRTHWRAFTGGPDLWREVDIFFARLERDARG